MSFSSLVSSATSEIFSLANQASPIILTNGIANSIGGYMPIIAITEAVGLREIASLATTGEMPSQYFANFRPVPGSTLIKNEVAMYPFFTQQIAANAQIQQPLNVSMLMVAPAGQGTPFPTKLATMSAMKSMLDVHTNLGGTYIVVTPSWIYTNCLLTQISDVSTDETNQSQWVYQWDFVQPLLTFPGFNTVENAATSLLTDGGTFLPDASGSLNWSGVMQKASQNVFGYQ